MIFCFAEAVDRADSMFSLLDMQFPCVQCGKVYKHKTSLTKHRKYECGVEAQFQCPHCPYKAKQKVSLISHLFTRHKQIDAWHVNNVTFCILLVFTLYNFYYDLHSFVTYNNVLYCQNGKNVGCMKMFCILL